ncbi:MAG: hypothetical protein J4F42_14955 [Desulfurellaceae bacterium]|nr:hypothetical protein [Desulfurellaceae bacterium]
MGDAEDRRPRLLSCEVLGAAAVLLFVGSVCVPSAQPPPGDPLPATTARQIEALLARKAQRTPAQRKVSSQLLDAWRAGRDQLGGTELVTVDIRAEVTPAVLERIQTLGGTVLNSVPKYRAIRARLPLAAVEPLATLDAVQSIRPADRAQTRSLSPAD